MSTNFKLWSALAICFLVAATVRAEFAYVANANTYNVLGFRIDPRSGALIPVAVPRWVHPRQRGGGSLGAVRLRGKR